MKIEVASTSSTKRKMKWQARKNVPEWESGFDHIIIFGKEFEKP